MAQLSLKTWTDALFLGEFGTLALVFGFLIILIIGLLAIYIYLATHC